MHFAMSTHGTLTLIEALTPAALAFLLSIGFVSKKVAVTYPTLREIRYAARAAGLAIG